MKYYILLVNDKSYFAKFRSFFSEYLVDSITCDKGKAYKFETLKEVREHQVKYGGKIIQIKECVFEEEVH